MSFQFDVDNFTLTKNANGTNGGPEYYYYYYYYYFNFREFFSAFRFQLDIFLWKYMSLVLSIIAFFGNITVVLVLLQKKSRAFSTSVFIINLAIADIFVCMSALEGFLLINRHIDNTYSDFDCKFRMFLPKVTQYVSVWMLVFISIERALSVKVPLKVKTIFTLRFARILVVLVWILSIAKASISAATVKLQNNVSGTPSCFNILVQFSTLYFIDLILYVSLSILIPYPIILICTIITISTLLQNKITKSKSSKAQVKSITVTLVIVNVVYLLSVAPAVVYEVYTLFWITFSRYIRWTIVDYYNHLALLNILTFVSFIHNAFNIFIYFLSGSRFRSETKELMFICKSKK